MPERIFLFSSLKPASALQLVADYLEADGALPELLNEMQVRVIETSSARRDPDVTVALPDPFRERKAKEKQAAGDALIAAYKSMTKGDGPVPSSNLPDPEHFEPLLSALPDLLSSRQSRQALIHSGRSQELIEYPLLRDEKLLLGCNLAADQSEEFFGRLQFYATQVRVAFAETIVDDASDRFVLYYFKDDEARVSDFESAWIAEFFEGCALLDCYRDERTESVVALPPNIVPHRDTLTHFCRILMRAPAQFRGSAPTLETEILAVVSSPDQRQPDLPCYLLYTGHLHFCREWEIAPRAVDLSHCRLLVLDESAEALKTLRQKVDEARPRLGYQLELRRASYRRWNEPEYNRLLLLQQRIDDRLIELASLQNRPRPKLYRFTQGQLPVLADVLRSYPPDRLSQLRYGFYASEGYHPEGLHFIYVDHDVPVSDLDPLTWWPERKTQPMEFWLDPHWAYHYQSESYSSVFVPRGTRLYPSMHSWEIETMDAYLREILSEYFHGRGGVMSLSDAALPLYVFDGLPGRDQALYLAILDLKEFVPIASPRCLGWLNDNLHLLDQLGVDKFISGMADEVARRRLDADLARTATVATHEFDERAKAFFKTTAQGTHELTRVIDAELDNVVENTSDFIVKANELNNRLKALWQLYDAMAFQAEKTEHLVDLARQEEQSLDERMADLVQSVNTSLSDARRDQAGLERQVSGTVEAIQEARTTLLETVAKLKTLLPPDA